MSEPNTAAPSVAFKRFRSPKTVIARFVAARSWHGAVLWAAAFSIMVVTKATGYVAAYPTLKARQAVIATLGNNAGLDALLGRPYHMETVQGFITWNALSIMAIIGSVWALLLTTRTFRGEETAGRWELLLSGQTTMRRATVNAIVGLLAAIGLLYGLCALLFINIGTIHSVDFGVGAALYFALAATAGPLMFMAIASLASQIMPTRARAASLTAGIFVASFLLRAMGDTATSAHWLLNITPLGWIEKLRPLYGEQPTWLIPIVALTAVVLLATIWLAGRRDLGESVLADKETARPRTGLLNAPLQLALRLTRVGMGAWIFAAGFVALAFSFLAKSAAEAFASSAGAGHLLGSLTRSTRTLGATTFLGIIFFILMVLIMAFAATMVGAVREEEAEGYLDNLLVQPLARTRWLLGRIGLAVGGIVTAGLLISAASWFAVTRQQLDISAHTLVIAGINAMAPALLTLGIGILGFGFAPRICLIGCYVVIAWSFLLQMLSSGINLNHWILDTSVLHHMALAPAINPNWTAFSIVSGLGVLGIIFGVWRFAKRDLEAE
ncbi:MAG TPA: ABC transporter permease subunit [Candidatus Saccharimonadales bacterium]|nr:ABC transporter permease subunit [Candidatus Saccharimonadales bacterium]